MRNAARKGLIAKNNSVRRRRDGVTRFLTFTWNQIVTVFLRAAGSYFPPVFPVTNLILFGRPVDAVLFQFSVKRLGKARLGKTNHFCAFQSKMLFQMFRLIMLDDGVMRELG